MTPHTIKSIDFFRAGNAVFTVAGPTKHYTFKIKKKEKSPFFVNLLTGPNNVEDFSYIGIYIPNKNHEIRLTAKSKFKNDSTPVKTIRWALRMISEKRPIPQGWDIKHEGKCCRCGKRLTTPESIDAGIGPECGKMNLGPLFGIKNEYS